jgi:subtilase family serine protease
MTRPGAAAELRGLLLLGAILAALCLFPRSVRGQAVGRIARPVDPNVRTRQPGSRHPLARPEFDLRRVAPESPMERMILVLQPDASQEQELEDLLAAQQDSTAPLFHQWLTPEEFGRRFGVSDGDLNQVVGWLAEQGFSVEPLPAGRRQVVFSGTAGQIETAFHTEIHEYLVNGAIHHANASDIEIPSALAPVVGGVLSLHDFHSKPMHAVIQPANTRPEYTSGGVHYVVPGDFARIYDLGPLYGSSTDGRGQSIAIVARSNLKLADIEAFRSNFGLTGNDPNVIVNGTDPGVLSTDELGEVELDTEWAGAVAPAASIQVVVSKSTSSTDGVALSAQYIVNRSLAPVVSVSFGDCESALGHAGNQFWNTLWQQAASQGMSVFVASGDSGAAECDSPSASTGSTVDVNGVCSTPYATCVGGTEFNDSSNPAQYWSSTNGSGLMSATGYIPEIAWNESGSAGGTGLWATGGGASHTYSKPSWQTGRGVPADTHRDVPDVALASASHDGYLFNMNGSSYAGSGTSVAAPAFAGLMALVAGRQGARQGNANKQLYTLAANQAQGGPAVFHDITNGNNTVPGVAGFSAGAGYDPVTGLGSVDANLLVNAWNNGSAPPPPCTYSLGATSAAPDATAQNLSVLLTASAATCAWTAASDSDWLVITSGPSGTGSQTVVLSITANPSSAPRTGMLTIAGLAFPVTQAGAACTYSLSASMLRSGAGGLLGSVSVSAPIGCAWTAASPVSWMIITAGASGSGSGIVTFTVAANSSGTRSATLTIAGSTVTVTEAPRPRLGLDPLPIPRTTSQ